jgi:hypothetical protein
MANTFRYFNLKQLSPGTINGLGVSWDVEDVAPLFHSSSDRGSIASSADAFPHKGAGTHKGNFLNTSFSFGGLTASSGARVFDYGSIA